MAPKQGWKEGPDHSLPLLVVRWQPCSLRQRHFTVYSAAPAPPGLCWVRARLLLAPPPRSPGALGMSVPRPGGGGGCTA